MCGAAACTWKSALSTCTFAVYARRSSHGSSKTWCRQSEAQAIDSRQAPEALAPMNRSVESAWKRPLALTGGLALGGVAGWFAGGHVATGVAIVAIAEIVLLLTHLRHIAQ